MQELSFILFFLSLTVDLNCFIILFEWLSSKKVILEFK